MHVQVVQRLDQRNGHVKDLQSVSLARAKTVPQLLSACSHLGYIMGEGKLYCETCREHHGSVENFNLPGKNAKTFASYGASPN